MKVDKSTTSPVRIGTLNFGDCFLDTLGNCYIVVDEDFDADDNYFMITTQNGAPVDGLGYTFAVNLETGSGTAFHNDELITPIYMVAKISED